MKRISLFVLVIVLAMVLPAMAGHLVYHAETGDAQISATSDLFIGFILTPDGTNDVTIDFYDNTTGSGTKFYPSMTFAGDGGPRALILPEPLPTLNGIYINITTAGTVAYTIITQK
jgi:hypothetical protein